MSWKENTLRFCSRIGIFSFISTIGVGFVAYTATHVYVCFCAPKGLWGFIQSLVIMDSTFCQMILGIIHHSHSLYGAMVVGLLFSLLAAINNGVAWLSGVPVEDVPLTIRSRPITRSMSKAITKDT